MISNFEISLSNGNTIQASADHKFVVRKFNGYIYIPIYKLCQDLEVGETIITRNSDDGCVDMAESHDEFEIVSIKTINNA